MIVSPYAYCKKENIILDWLNIILIKLFFTVLEINDSEWSYGTDLFSAILKKITTIDKHVLQIILNNSYKLVALHAYDLHMNTLQLLLHAIYFKINTKSSYK